MWPQKLQQHILCTDFWPHVLIHVWLVRMKRPWHVTSLWDRTGFNWTGLNSLFLSNLNDWLGPTVWIHLDRTDLEQLSLTYHWIMCKHVSLFEMKLTTCCLNLTARHDGLWRDGVLCHMLSCPRLSVHQIVDHKVFFVSCRLSLLIVSNRLTPLQRRLPQHTLTGCSSFRI